MCSAVIPPGSLPDTLHHHVCVFLGLYVCNSFQVSAWVFRCVLVSTLGFVCVFATVNSNVKTIIPSGYTCRLVTKAKW